MLAQAETPVEKKEDEPLSPYNCMVCNNKLSLKRFRKKANTCSLDCQKHLKMMRRQLRDNRYCRLCHKPSTPEQRKKFKAYAATLEKKKPGRKPKPKPINAPKETGNG